MARDLRALVALIAKWKAAAVWEEGEMGNTQYANALDQCADELESALAGQAVVPSTDVRALVLEHRRDVELSPGVGAEAQSYALAVCDDILTALAREVAGQAASSTEPRENLSSDYTLCRRHGRMACQECRALASHASPPPERDTETEKDDDLTRVDGQPNPNISVPHRSDR